MARKRPSNQTPEDDRSTRSGRRRKAAADGPADEVVASRPSRGLMLLVFALAAGVWFAPQLLGGRAVRSGLLQDCLPEGCPPATVGSVSAGWLSPVILSDVRIAAPDGGPSLTVESLRTGRSLLGLVQAWCCGGSGFDLGTVVLDRPRLVVAVREGGSSLEDWLGGGGEAGPIPSGRVAVREGVVVLADADGRELAVVRDADLDYAWGRGAYRPTAVTLRAEVIAGEDGGRLGLTLVEAAGEESRRPGLKVVAEDVPLAALDAAALYVGTPSEFYGRVDSEFTLTLSEGLGGSGRVAVENLVIRDKADDRRFVVTRATAAGRVEAEDGRLRVKSAKLDGDFGTGEVTADLPLDRLVVAPLAACLAADVTADLDCDLAAISRASRSLGGEVEELEAGRLRVRLSARHGEAGHRLSAKAEVSDLAVAGRPAAASPFTLDVDAGYTRDGFDVRTLACRSSFLMLEGGGTRARASARATLDLGRFEAETARWFGREPRGNRGVLEARVAAVAEGSNRLTVEAVVTGREIAARLFDVTFREPSLRATGSAALVTEGLTPVAAERGRVEIEFGGDRVVADLLEPLDLAAGGISAARLGVTATGDAGRFVERLARMSDSAAPVPGLSGRLDGRTELVLADESVTVSGLDATVTSLRFRADGVDVRENRVRVTGGLTSRRDATDVVAEEIVWRSDSLSCRLSEVAVAGTDGGLRGGARVAYRGGLDRVAGWFPGLSATRPGGVVEGGGTLKIADGKLDYTGRSEVSRPALLGATGPVWSGQRATLDAAVSYAAVEDRLDVTRFGLTADANAANVTGSIASLTSSAVAELTGDLTLDPASLAGESGVTLSGPTKQPLTVRGPLLPPAGRTVDPSLVVETGVGWASGNAGGFPLGPASLPVKLSGGVATVTETSVAASGGTVRLGGTVDLRGERTVVRFPSGRLADRVQVTPAVTASWLSRATPLVAGTGLTGAVSVDVSQAALPADRPELVSSQSRVHLHELVGTAGGPAASLYGVLSQIEQISDLAGGGGDALGILNSATSLAGNLLGGGGGVPVGGMPNMTVPEQTVSVTTRNGVITHDRMLVRFGDSIEVTTSGRVASDGRIDLVAAVPVLDRWVGDRGLPDSLRGQTLRIPIGGTLESPQVDGRVVAELLRATGAGRVENELRGRLRDELGEEADDAVGELIDRGLRGLFRR
ncbi:MAG: hypothetical protein AAF532_04770 [Planctomycetota bacterium]